MKNAEIPIRSDNGGYLLAVSAILFWLSWLLMPGVGVTDSQEIFRLVGSQRTSVMLSVIFQLASATLYVPAILQIVTDPRVCLLPGLRRWAGVLLVGAMGSAADAVLHLLAYAMTSPGIAGESLIPVMAFMQGPGLLILAPMIACFFVGGAGLAIVLSRAGVVSHWNVRLHAAAFLIAIFGGLLASGGLLSSRLVGLAVLAAVSFAQAWTGLAVVGNRTRGLPLNLLINKKEQL